MTHNLKGTIVFRMHHFKRFLQHFPGGMPPDPLTLHCPSAASPLHAVPIQKYYLSPAKFLTSHNLCPPAHRDGGLWNALRLSIRFPFTPTTL